MHECLQRCSGQVNYPQKGVWRPKSKKKKLAATDLTIHNFNIQDAEGKVIVALKEIAAVLSQVAARR